MKKIIISSIIILLLLVSFFFIFNSILKKKNYDYSTVEEYYTNSNNQKIFTKLYKPNTDKKVPIVIYSHGLGATYRAASDYGEHLAKEGIALIAIDFRGGSSRSKSDGKTTDMSILTECDDLEFILSKVLEFDFVDKDKIILMGSSQGGAVSAIISSRYSDIKGTVLLYPALSIPSFVRGMYKSKDEIPEVVDNFIDSIILGRKYFLDVWDYNPYDEVANDTKKIAIIHGTIDRTVPISQSEELNKLYKNSNLYKVEGAGHGFSDEYFDEAIKYVDKYLKDINVLR